VVDAKLSKRDAPKGGRALAHKQNNPLAGTEARLDSAGKLKHPREYRAVFAHGARIGAGCFLIIAHRNGLDFARLGLGIAKRQVPTAVARNRLKRVIRESFRANAPTLKGYDIVVLARRPASALSKREVREQLSGSWDKVPEAAQRQSEVRKTANKPANKR